MLRYGTRSFFLVAFLTTTFFPCQNKLVTIIFPFAIYLAVTILWNIIMEKKERIEPVPIIIVQMCINSIHNLMSTSEITFALSLNDGVHHCHFFAQV